LHYQKELQDFQNEYHAFAALRTAGILVVCSAGNYGNDNGGNQAIYPASHDLDNIISVASSTYADSLWDSSNYGLTSVDLMAPGGDTGTRIWSACLSNTYCYKYGTSMAAPHVSGVAGLILSRNPNLSYSRVKSVILDTADRIGSAAYKIPFGRRLNAAAALASVCLPGDLTGNGRVELADVILALQVAAGLNHGSAQACTTADVNGDDLIGLAEAVYGLRVLSGAGE
jgi:subtilisin family serine protease